MTTSNAKATHVSTLHTFMKYVHFKLTKSQSQLIQNVGRPTYAGALC